jgi:hypothetical protein
MENFKRWKILRKEYSNRTGDDGLPSSSSIFLMNVKVAPVAIKINFSWVQPNAKEKHPIAIQNNQALCESLLY